MTTNKIAMIILVPPFALNLVKIHEPVYPFSVILFVSCKEGCLSLTGNNRRYGRKVEVKEGEGMW